MSIHGFARVRAREGCRNLTKAEIARCIAAIDKRMTRKESAKHAQEVRDGIEAPNGATTQDDGKTAEATAEAVGVSRATVERARYIQDHEPGLLLSAACCCWQHGGGNPRARRRA